MNTHVPPILMFARGTGFCATALQALIQWIQLYKHEFSEGTPQSRMFSPGARETFPPPNRQTAHQVFRGFCRAGGRGASTMTRADLARARVLEAEATEEAVSSRQELCRRELHMPVVVKTVLGSHFGR